MPSVEEPELQSDLTMRFATPIPAPFVAAQTMQLPIVVLFGCRTETLPDTNDIWVFVSLLNADSEVPLQEDLLHGRRADSVHPLLERDRIEVGDFAYASFANLVVSARGRYRFCMTAVDMKR